MPAPASALVAMVDVVVGGARGGSRLRDRPTAEAEEVEGSLS